MIRELEVARGKIKQELLERAAVCDQIDLVLCESPGDVMAYVYSSTGACFLVLIELGDAIQLFERERFIRDLWPRCDASTIH
jgi:hypothetical protein